MSQATETSKRYDEIAQSGPATAEAIGGHPSVDERRIYNLMQFSPLPGYRGVWHLPRHAPRDVLCEWLDANEDELKANGVPQRKLTGALSTPFDEAWDEMKDGDEFEWMKRDRSNKTGAAEQSNQTCPKCGDGEVKNLPRHLRACDGDSDE